MNTATPCVLSVERVDDIPVLFASLQRLQVAEFLDRHKKLARGPPPFRGRGNRVRPSHHKMLL